MRRLIERIRRLFARKSQSLIMQEFGEAFGEGFKLGIEEGSKQHSDCVSFDEVKRMLGNVEFTVALSDLKNAASNYKARTYVSESDRITTELAYIWGADHAAQIYKELRAESNTYGRYVEVERLVTVWNLAARGVPFDDVIDAVQNYRESALLALHDSGEFTIGKGLISNIKFADIACGEITELPEDPFSKVADAAADFTITLSSFRFAVSGFSEQMLGKSYCWPCTNNWLRMHGYPTRRMKQVRRCFCRTNIRGDNDA